MEQKSKEWFDARRGKLTGSNVGSALGLNPWKTPDDLIRQMVREYHGAEPEFTGNVATEYGNLHEPLAVMEYLGKTGNHVEDCGFYVDPAQVHLNGGGVLSDWLGASPDGLVGENGLIEVKCPFGLRNKKGDELTFKGAIEQPHYYAQMQVEMVCADREWCDFYQWSKHGDSLERVYFNSEWWSENKPKLVDFYQWYLAELDNPEHLEDKQKEINTLKAKKLIDEWDKLKAMIDDAESRKKEVLAELVKISGERDALMHGRKLTKVERKGNVNYKKIPELEGVDLEKYRGKPSEFWRLS